MSARPKKTSAGAGVAEASAQERARRLAQAHGADPERLLAWALRADGRVAAITAEGRKLIESQ